jgi:hypothetical protein
MQQRENNLIPATAINPCPVYENHGSVLRK